MVMRGVLMSSTPPCLYLGCESCVLDVACCVDGEQHGLVRGVVPQAADAFLILLVSRVSFFFLVKV